ncbi:urease accessory protein UreD [Paenibacillus sp. YAF4_2]|uniref:urease accessory protein UreD n=1 Tax=Paenibacillus sp. YAF4_2 TaxID=3233085 RepID=UPI003F95FF4D
MKTSNERRAATVLRASFRYTDGVTTLADKYHTSPIKIAKTFPLKEQLGVIIMDASPGLLEGDCYELEWKAGSSTHSCITTQSYMKVHPSLTNGSSIRQTFHLGDHAIVEHMPEPVMLYKEARFHNDTNVYLGQGAVWMQADILCPGRTLRKERFQYTEFRNALSVYYGHELIYAQRQRIVPESQKLASPGSWDEMTHIATFCLFTDRLTPSHIQSMKQLVEKQPSMYGAHPVVIGVSETQRYGLVAAAASTAAWPLQEAMRSIWNGARSILLHKEPVILLYS